MITYLLFGITFAFAAAVQPGPLLTFLMSKSLEKGWQRTLPAAFAPLISDIPIFCLIIFLLSNLPGSFIIFLRIGGGLFVFYLAYHAYLTWKNYEDNQSSQTSADKTTLWSAVLVNLLNPGPYLGWSLIMGPLFLQGWKISALHGIALVAGFYITMIITLMGLIFLFSFARKMGEQVSRILIGLSALALSAFGIYQIWMGIIPLL